MVPEDVNLSSMSQEELLELLSAIDQLEKSQSENLIDTFYTDDGGKNDKKHYKKHMAFFEAGAEFFERVLFGGNRVGKTTGALIENTFHAMNRYPEWWKGKRFYKAVLIWEVGKTAVVTMNTIQEKLVGRPGMEGTGFLPKESITTESGRINKTSKAGISGAIQDLFVKCDSGGYSQISFKSYDQKMDAFMGAAVQVVHLDEEPPQNIYDECMMRTLTCNGIMMSTFTPLKGFSSVVKSFLNEEGSFPEDNVVVRGNASKWVVRVSWEDVPEWQIPEEMRQRALDSMTPHMRDARSKGIPSAGSGMVWPALESDYVIAPFDITESPNYLRCFALDIGWHRTAALFGAYDEVNDIVYIYDEYYASDLDPISHAAKMRKKTKGFIPGVIDPSSRRTREDGLKTMDEYIDNGLELYIADNSFETGITKVYNRMVTGRLKVFHNCKNLQNEIRQYAYDDHGNIKGKAAGRASDHLCDALRYLIMSGLDNAMAVPEFEHEEFNQGQQRLGNSVTGY